MPPALPDAIVGQISAYRVIFEQYRIRENDLIEADVIEPMFSSAPNVVTRIRKGQPILKKIIGDLVKGLAQIQHQQNRKELNDIDFIYRDLQFNYNVPSAIYSFVHFGDRSGPAWAAYNKVPAPLKIKYTKYFGLGRSGGSSVVQRTQRWIPIRR